MQQSLAPSRTQSSRSQHVVCQALHRTRKVTSAYLMEPQVAVEMLEVASTSNVHHHPSPFREVGSHTAAWPCTWQLLSSLSIHASTFSTSSKDRALVAFVPTFAFLSPTSCSPCIQLLTERSSLEGLRAIFLSINKESAATSFRALVPFA